MKVLRIAFIVLLIFTFRDSNCQIPIPGHAASIVDGNGNVPFLEGASSVFVTGNYAYVASAISNALQIVDVSNPAVPRAMGKIIHGFGGAKLNGASSVFVLGNYAYVASKGSNALEIVDVSNPAAPFHKSSISNGSGGAKLDTPTSVFVSGNYAYITSRISNALEIIDISNPNAPLHKGSLTHGTNGALLENPSNVYVSGKHAYVASTLSNALEIVDVSNPANPIHKGKLVNGSPIGAKLSGASAVYVSGNYAYVVSSFSNSLVVIDVSNPANPIYKGNITNGYGPEAALLNSPTAVFVSGSYAYIASVGSNALEIVDVSNPSNPVHTTSMINGTDGALLKSPYSVYVLGGFAYVASYASNALEIISLFLPSKPTAKNATLINFNSFTANWNSMTNATSYLIDVSTDVNFYSFLEGYKAVSSSTNSLRVFGLNSSTSYYYRIRASNLYGLSDNSNTVTVLTTPTSVTAMPASLPTQTGFTANWNAASGAVANYFIDVSKDQNFASVLTSYNNRSVPSTATSLAITGLSSGTTYYYRVRTANATGSSPSSNIISQITIPANPIASPGSNQAPDSFTAAWQDVIGKDSFELDVSLDNFNTFVTGFYSKIIAGNVFQIQINGLSPSTTYQYRVRSKNSAGVSSNSNPVTVITSSLPAPTSYQIPFPIGGKLEDFRIVSIPLGTVASTNLQTGNFGTNWRVQHYNNIKDLNDDIKDMGQLSPLQGYWVNSNISGTPMLIATGSFVKRDTSLTLSPKWNQIGNPFITNISWSEILSQNPAAQNISQLYTYNAPTVSEQGFQAYDGLLAFGGGFVNNANTTPVTLKIPSSLKLFSGRLGNQKNSISNTLLTETAWFLPIKIQAGNTYHTLAGLGMHPNASISFDAHDAIALPKLFTGVEFSSMHTEFFQPRFMKDVVPSDNNYTWTFTASSSSPEIQSSLLWDSKSLGDNPAKLILYDLTEGIFIDMKTIDRYNFHLIGEHTIKFFFSANGEILPDIIDVGNPYPNPFSIKVNIPFVTNKNNTQLQLVVYDGLGRPVRQLVNKLVEAGLHEVVWDATDDQELRVPNGIYFYRFSISGMPIKSGKLILK